MAFSKDFLDKMSRGPCPRPRDTKNSLDNSTTQVQLQSSIALIAAAVVLHSSTHDVVSWLDMRFMIHPSVIWQVATREGCAFLTLLWRRGRPAAHKLCTKELHTPHGQDAVQQEHFAWRMCMEGPSPMPPPQSAQDYRKLLGMGSRSAQLQNKVARNSSQHGRCNED
eukprot:1869045-Amphidinium_carterae.3